MIILINRLLLTINCKVLDTMVPILLAINDWLNGSKWITPIVIIVTVFTHLHDSVHRHLIDDINVDEQGT
ncbi:unnamed protein product [Rotaria sp. Silwood2]|nr:unnamed protein product [Rotaria sp. Silwood2]CAF4254590.1 unnamed protein product [Rotaria sp. Silwood2]CAF4364533.1 unnamed protein product [Rotaria sp. Silwood2]CAF4777130.1 unnamed protein product [Rotaria sp. Silwood2]